MQPGYDHSYFFMASFIGDHVAFHAARLKVIAALPLGLDAAVKAVLEAEGADFLNTSGSLKRQIRDCLKANLPTA
jgi:hypothetical protein